mgnify:FL=1
MKKCKRVLGALCMAVWGLSGTCALALDNVDADGMPIIYLRGGDIGETPWACSESLRFERNGQNYSLHVDRLSGEFKIATYDFKTFDYGAPVPKPDTYTLIKSQTFNALQAGGNLVAKAANDVTISFEYVKNAASIPVRYQINGEDMPVEGLSGTLPVLYINVYDTPEHLSYNNEIISKDLDHKNYFSEAEYWLDPNGCALFGGGEAKAVGSASDPLPLEIKARGNWTRRGFAKKPFKLKLGKKQSLLGMTKSKHYAILAHADDTWGYMRNFVGFNLGKRIGLPWTPAQQPIEVVINGDYRGLYFLTESIRVGDDRVPVTELDDNVSDPALVSGGYLVELDNYEEENQIRMDEKSCVPGLYCDQLRITWDTPELYSDLQKRFVTDQFAAINDRVGANSDELWAYLDLDDAARYYVVEEIIANVESYHGSTYLFRERGEGEKWHFSPLWDCGNAFVGPTDDYFYKHGPYGNTWIPSMRCNDRFNDKVKATWLWFMQNHFDGLYSDIAAHASAVKSAAVADRRRWKDVTPPQGGQAVADNTDIDNARQRVDNFLAAKINWLKGQWGDYTVGTHSEPDRDATPAAPLPDYALGGIVDVTESGHHSAADALYNLQGIRINRPVAGQIYIRISNGRAEKFLAR